MKKKTLREVYAAKIQSLARKKGERRLYEACSWPWFVHDWVEPEPEPGRIQAGDLVKVEESDFVRPFAQFVLVVRCEDADALIVVDEGCDKIMFGCAPVGGWEWFEVPGEERMVNAMALAFWLQFSQCYRNPGVHVAVVRPLNAMRSVEWKRSQSHYVLLRGKHPANVERGAREMDYDEAAVLKRMAHWVRGHERIYRHPRYKKAMGMKQWIAAVWRGPKEWINKRSRQVYRWVDKKTLGGAA